jgi:chemotaxis protein CheD
MPPKHRPKNVFLQPGEYFVGDGSHCVRTVLGSCVSITIWHAASQTGAMSHFLLPTRGRAKAVPPDGRYADEALWLMLHELALRNVSQTQCEAKIFGGGNMFPLHTKSRSSVGHNNGLAARTLLTACGIPIISESLFGEGHRQIIFDISTGDVWSRQTSPTDVAHLHPVPHVAPKTAKGSA